MTQEKMPTTTTKKCKTCKKDIVVWKECEEEGASYHSECFRCRICDNFLNEYTVLIRRKRLYCKYHGTLLGGLQPFCKVYFNDTGLCYRIIYATDKGWKPNEKRGKMAGPGGGKGGKKRGGGEGGGGASVAEEEEEEE